MAVSMNFKIAVKFCGLPQYRVAQKADLDPAVLSKIMRGSLKVQPKDKRVLAVGAVLGLKPEQCFEKHEER